VVDPKNFEGNLPRGGLRSNQISEAQGDISKIRDCDLLGSKRIGGKTRGSSKGRAGGGKGMNLEIRQKKVADRQGKESSAEEKGVFTGGEGRQLCGCDFNRRLREPEIRYEGKANQSQNQARV